MRRAILALTATVVVLAVPGAAHGQGTGSPNLTHVKNLPYDARYGDVANYGTDVEFATIAGRRYALAGSEKNGLQIVDVTKPAEARRVAVYDCAVSQGDVQVFKRGTRTYATYTNDYEQDATTATSACFAEAQARGLEAIDAAGNAKLGTFVVDVTQPAKPRTVSFVAIPQGSHNMTVHPSGEYLYNSNSDLITSLQPAIEVFDIRDLTSPKAVAELPLTALPGLGTESHDITFNADGTRAYSAALSHGVIIDTTNPAQPRVVTEFDDETINVWHQSDPVTIGNRELLLVEDEVAGAAGPGVCPSGGVHVFDISVETQPIKVGYWNIDDIAVDDDPLATCTAHVFDVHEEAHVMTIAYYMGGVRVVDLSGLADARVGVGIGDTTLGGAMKEVAHFIPENANTWSAKTPRVEPDGSFWLYGNDINRGLDVYRYDATKPKSDSPGRFLAPAALTRALDGVDLRGDRRLICLLPALGR